MRFEQLIGYGEAIGGGAIAGIIDTKYPDKKIGPLPPSAAVGVGLAIGGVLVGGTVGRHAGEIGAGMLAGWGYRAGAINAASAQNQSVQGAFSPSRGVAGALGSAPSRGPIQRSEVDAALAFLAPRAA